MEDLKRRIDRVAIELYNGNNSAMARDLNTSDVNIGNYRKPNGVAPKVDFLIELNEKLKISFEWLITGKGEMFMPEPSEETLFTLEEPPATYRSFLSDDFDLLESIVARMRKRFEELSVPGQNRDKTPHNRRF